MYTFVVLSVLGILSNGDIAVVLEYAVCSEFDGFFEIHQDRSAINMKNCTITENRAKLYGGAILVVVSEVFSES